MRQAITTRYLGPTNSRGSRIKALARKATSRHSGWGYHPEMSLTDGYDHAGNHDDNHCRVAKLLAIKLGWSGLWIAGGLPTEDGNCYVNLHVGPDTDLQQHMANLYSLQQGRDWFFVPEAVPIPDQPAPSHTGEAQ